MHQSDPVNIDSALSLSLIKNFGCWGQSDSVIVLGASSQYVSGSFILIAMILFNELSSSQFLGRIDAENSL